MGAPQEPAERCDPDVVLLGPDRRTLDVGHRAELQHPEVPSTPSDTGLGEEERTAVGDEVSDDDERKRREQRHQADRRRREVHQALEARVTGEMDLTDVEEHRDPFEIVDGELAEPFLGDRDQRANPDTALVKDRGLDYHRIVVLHITRALSYTHLT